MRRLLPLLLAALSTAAHSQALVSAPASAAALGSTVNPDHTITFRLLHPGAHTVTVVTDATLAPIPLTDSGAGLWTATTPPLPPEHYGYTFIVDGVHTLDPLNRESHPNFVDLYSDLLVPATPPAPWELTAIPHGSVTHHNFTTHIGLHYPADQTAYVVYTPPNYDPHRQQPYPVLYLLHGYSDTEEGWTRSGQADLILDRLLADHKIVPMVVVMPRGYGDFDIVSHGRQATADPALGRRNVALFSRTLTEEILPAIERDYNVAHDPAHRAIAGLSMGGQEALALGLTHPGLFAWVGGMSAGLPQNPDFNTLFPIATPPTLKLLWIACGTDDHLITPNRALVAWARSKNLPVTPVETPGAHTFVVWRDNLLTLAPLLFR